jgi:hypothetical protein
MAVNATAFLLSLALAMWPIASQAKGADGLVTLVGTIGHAKVHADAVSFSFAGSVSFSFFTAAQDNPERKRIDLAFKVQNVSIRIPSFGGNEYDNENNPFRVSYKNAVMHALELADSGEKGNIVLVEPKLSYDRHGVLVQIDCALGQVIPDHLERSLRAPKP